MEIILLERVEKLGKLGDVVKVKAGYARNYLLPKGKALRASTESKARFEAERAALEARNLKLHSDAESAKSAIDGLEVAVVRAASEAGVLYGSVTARDIGDALEKKGHNIPRANIIVPTPIKNLGKHSVKIRFHADVYGEVSVNVVKNEDEIVA